MGMVLTDEEIEKNLKPSEKRIKTEFLFFPMEINGVSKWLETATYMEIKVHKTFYRPIINEPNDRVVWEKFKWIE